MSRFEVRKRLRQVAIEKLGVGKGYHRSQAMKFTSNTAKTIAVLAGTATAVGMTTNSAMAFSVNQSSDTNAFLSSLLGDTSGLSNFSITTTGDARAFGFFQDDPFGLGKGVVLSTGRVDQLVGSPSDFASTSLGTTPGDLAQIDIGFNAGSTASNLFFSYVFGSEEFPEFGGSSFNDSFELLLNGTNLALLDNGKPVTVNNLAASPTGPFDPAYVTAAASSTSVLDAYTKVLTFSGAINKNANNVLSIKVKDVGDTIYDSAVFIKGGSIGTVKPPTEPVPEPITILGTLTAGGIGAAMRRKSKLKAKEAVEV
jgi:hypothetical protein